MNVKVSGLLPAQERLVRYCAWRDHAKGEVTRLTTARDHFFTAMGAPTVAQAALDGLIQQDTTGFLAWVRAGAAKVNQFTVDSFRRQQLETKLAEATHEAEIARTGLAGIDQDIETAEKVVQILDGRHTEFVRATILEAAAGRVGEYDAAITHLQKLAAGLAGAGKVIADGRFASRTDSINVRLPSFGSTTAQLLVEREEIEQAAKPWRDLEKRLMADPRSSLTVEPA